MRKTWVYIHALFSKCDTNINGQTCMSNNVLSVKLIFRTYFTSLNDKACFLLWTDIDIIGLTIT